MPSSAVSRWLKQILEMTGIDTDIFKGHLTRGALSTKADVSGVSVSESLLTNLSISKLFLKNILYIHVPIIKQWF